MELRPDQLEEIRKAARLHDSGRADALLSNFASSTSHPQWWIDRLHSLTQEVLSEYRLLKAAYEQRPKCDLPLLAWRARNILELMMWAVFCAKGEANAKRFAEDSRRDAVGLYETMINWGKASGQSREWMNRLERGKADVARSPADGTLVESRYKRVAHAADECGMRGSFDANFRLLSKFAHPTSLRITASKLPADYDLPRDLFFSIGCMFFHGAIHSLEEALK